MSDLTGREQNSNQGVFLSFDGSSTPHAHQIFFRGFTLPPVAQSEPPISSWKKKRRNRNLPSANSGTPAPLTPFIEPSPPQPNRPQQVSSNMLDAATWKLQKTRTAETIKAAGEPYPNEAHATAKTRSMKANILARSVGARDIKASIPHSPLQMYITANRGININIQRRFSVFVQFSRQPRCSRLIRLPSPAADRHSTSPSL